ncbi:extracellular solute-binding protein [Cohnella zeiphila]|uniref:Extracellular solute-binding protein n=2 Tax=Cohnella zeiphila TaxID=2761120 RepID=A0A7X0SKR2_9BACL|nr:extracellular solute-binding protein [Cohnella zeiphila]MBB6731746.1 extracellular solute-binding protein [Cohnella zeiphila]
MNVHRQLRSSALTLLIAAAALTGCDQARQLAPENGVPAGRNDGEPVLLVANQNKYAPDTVPNLFIDEVEKRFGMKWNYVSVPLSAGIEKFKIMFASGNVPDMVQTINNFPAIRRWAEAGYLLPIGDYIGELPNYRKLFSDEEWQEVLDFASIDGKLYFLPSKIDVQDPMAWLYRKDAFEQAGIDGFPQTTEQLYEALKKLKAFYPMFEGIGVRGGPNDTGIKALLLGFQHAFRLPTDLGGADGWNGFWNDPDEGGRVVFGPASEKQRDMLVYLAKLYREGLIDRGFAALSEEQWAAKRRDGRDLIDFQWVSQLPGLNRVVAAGGSWDYSRWHLQAYDKPGLEFRPVPFGLYGPVFGSQLAGEDDKRERLLSYIDWAATDEGSLFHMMGLENVTYVKDEDGSGIRYKEGYDRQKVAKQYGFDWFLTKAGGLTLQDDTIAVSREAYGVYSGLPAVRPRAIPFTEEEWNTVTTAMDRVNEAVYRFATRAVMGLANAGDDEEWNRYLQSLDQAGLQDVLAIYRQYWGEQGS